MEFKIAVIKGDGIGPEIVEATIPVLSRVADVFGHRFKYEYLLAGGAALDKEGIPLPKKTIAACKASHAVLLGAVGDPKWDGEPGKNRPEQAILGLREALGLFANLRPAMVYDELSFACPLKTEIIAGGVRHPLRAGTDRRHLLRRAGPRSHRGIVGTEQDYSSSKG